MKLPIVTTAETASGDPICVRRMARGECHTGGREYEIHTGQSVSCIWISYEQLVAITEACQEMVDGVQAAIKADREEADANAEKTLAALDWKGGGPLARELAEADARSEAGAA